MFYDRKTFEPLRGRPGPFKCRVDVVSFGRNFLKLKDVGNPCDLRCCICHSALLVLRIAHARRLSLLLQGSNVEIHH